MCLITDKRNGSYKCELKKNSVYSPKFDEVISLPTNSWSHKFPSNIQNRAGRIFNLFNSSTFSVHSKMLTKTSGEKKPLCLQFGSVSTIKTEKGAERQKPSPLTHQTHNEKAMNHAFNFWEYSIRILKCILIIRCS